MLTIVDAPSKQFSAQRMGLDRTMGSVLNDLGAEAESLKRPESTTLDTQTKQVHPLDATQRGDCTNLSVGSSDNSEPHGSRIVRVTAHETRQVVMTRGATTRVGVALDFGILSVSLSVSVPAFSVPACVASLSGRATACLLLLLICAWLVTP